MKIIELFNDIANNKKVPNKIKISDCVYYFDINENVYTRFINNDKENPRGLLEDIDLHNAYVWFNLDVEILEDKSKKIELLNIEEYHTSNPLLAFNENAIELKINKLIGNQKEIANKVNYLLEKSDKL